MAEHRIDVNKLMKIGVRVKGVKKLTLRTKAIIFLLKLFADDVKVEVEI